MNEWPDTLIWHLLEAPFTTQNELLQVPALWMDKGVKGLIPRGKNTNGTLKNIEFTSDLVIYNKVDDNTLRTNMFFIGENKLGYYQDRYCFVAENRQEAENIRTNYLDVDFVIYIRDENVCVVNDTANSTLVDSEIIPSVFAVKFDNNYFVTSFLLQKEPVNLVDKTMVDGGFVTNRVVIASGVATSSSDTTYDISGYLPNDGYNYDVLITGYAAPSSSAVQKFVSINLRTDIITENVGVTQGRCQVSGKAADNYGSIWLPVGQERKVIAATNTSSNYSGTYSLILLGYRRLGTNL